MVETILTNGLAVLRDLVDDIGWLNGAADALTTVWKLERRAFSYRRKPRMRRALFALANELRQSWRPWEAT